MQITKTFTIFSVSRGLGKKDNKNSLQKEIEEKNSIKTEENTSTS